MGESPGGDSSTVTPPFDHPLQNSAGLRRLPKAPFRFCSFVVERRVVEFLAARVSDWDKEKKECDEAASSHDEITMHSSSERILLHTTTLDVINISG